jgi:hypothetical protein
MVNISFVTIDVNVFLLCIVLPILIALSGARQAQQKGEKVDWLIFSKTILLGLVTAGALNVATSEALLAILGTPIITEILDGVFNALLNKTQRTAKTA